MSGELLTTLEAVDGFDAQVSVPKRLEEKLGLPQLRFRIFETEKEDEVQVVILPYCHDQIDALLEAVNQGDLHQTRVVLENLQDPNDGEGQTPLQAATRLGDIDCARLLIEARADVDLEHHGQMPLRIAVTMSLVEMLWFLLQARADVNKADQKGKTALMIAATRDDRETLDCLIQGGADLDHCDKDGYSALSLAALFGHLQVAKTLIEAKADVQKTDSDGLTPLVVACVNDHEDIAHCLIMAGAGMCPGSTIAPLVVAYETGCFDLVEKLLDERADANVRDEHGTSLLIMAFENDDWNMVQYMVELRADVNQSRESDQRTALLVAAQHGDLEGMKLVISLKANITSTSKEGMTAMTHALEYRDEGMLRCLLDAKAAPPCRDDNEEVRGLLERL